MAWLQVLNQMGFLCFNDPMQSELIKDQTLQTLVDFIELQKQLPLSETEFHDCQRRLIDALGCGLAAFHQTASTHARTLAIQEAPSGVCTLIGIQHRTNASMAAFANSMMMRFLDGADTYPGGGGHPSDCWAGLLAVAQQQNQNIGQLFKAAQLAYAVFHNLFVSAQLRNKGVDNAFYVTLGTVTGCALLMGLSPAQTAHAISLAVVPNVSLAVARTGALSMWKAGASANASRNAVFAIQMAAVGIEGPARPFEGQKGLWDLTGPFQLASFDLGPTDLPRMERAHMKQFLCDYHSQTPILAALQLHEQLKGEKIQTIKVHTYAFAHDEVASDPEKWAPRNRETADHSMPWIVAGVLQTGHFGEHLFSEKQLKDPAHLELTLKVEVEEDPSFSLRFPNEVPCHIQLTSISGRQLEARVDLPLGHPNRPMPDSALNQKFIELTQPVLGAHAQTVLKSLWAANATLPIDEFLKPLTLPLSTHP